VRYDVVMVGYKLDASLKPAQALQSVLGLDLETARAMTRQFPAPVLTGLGLGRAQSVAEQLTQCGAQVEVRESRSSLAGEPAKLLSPSLRPLQVDGRGEGYAIGEILAPVARVAASASGPSRRPSREALDAGLRPQLEARGAAREQNQEAVLPTRSSASPEHDAAFAGITNFDHLDGYTDSAAALDVDEVAFRAIQRHPAGQNQARRRGPSLWQRLRGYALSVARSSLAWALSMMWLGLISALTLLAVGYALDPDDILGALQLRALSDQARNALGL